MLYYLKAFTIFDMSYLKQCKTLIHRALNTLPNHYLKGVNAFINSLSSIL